MLREINKLCSSIRISLAVAACNLFAICWASITAVSRRVAISVNNTTNSSPPKRATVSSFRKTFLKRCATSCNKASPTECPKESLMFLKRSKSIYINAVKCFWRLLTAMSCSNLSINNIRLGKVVKPS